MSNQPHMRGELPFPEAGEGVVLRFTNPDCDHLHKKFGDQWFGDAVARCNRADMTYLRECVAVGGKKDGKGHRIAFDELDCPVFVICEKVLDALFLAMHGRTFEAHLNHLDSVAIANAGKNDDEGNASSPEKS
ncbi:hypothetical protein MesoLjLc_50510 [Mesorhizobium sp. L-8-10]|uniref:hypothetical protein n=1 Tax=Mesorhizobium sp. L-8-10 TaxID=2744523 RepID=UPI001925CC0C|nr:hypothetical protein [Mesorhizobium sp. L-8-10]BCH33121.1 hypothetical protein MesoLjLc_50510 [Mesorhizobium sp. L-8-10]